MLPRVVLSAGGGSSFAIDRRSCGTLTGSRTAVAAGRIPVESVACKLVPDWLPLGVQTGPVTVMFASWVDNYYVFGSSLHNAVCMAETFEQMLLLHWGLMIKPDSRSVLSPEQPVDEWDSDKWPRSLEVDILGHLVCCNSSPWPCWRRTEKSMWAAFWGNCVGPKARSLSLSDRCRMMDRSVKPLLTFRNSRWPWTRTLADSQDRLQRRMLSQFVRIERFPSEVAEVWNRRRMRMIAGIARDCGTWGKVHASRVLAWADHLKRPRNATSLAASLFAWHDVAWLEARRRNPDLGGRTQRPGTRASSRHIVKRWDEALADAEHCFA